jgi:ribosomal protein S18 acetylase RimI-like enzyme
VEVRDASADEYGFLGNLRVTAYQAGGHLSPQSGYTERLRVLGSDGKADVLAAVDGSGTLVGTVMLQLWPQASEVVRGPGEAEIRALAVDPGSHGRGIGAALVAAVTRRARERGVRHLLLLTQPDMLAAHALYARAGFTRLPERDTEPEPGVLLLAFGKLLDTA